LIFGLITPTLRGNRGLTQLDIENDTNERPWSNLVFKTS